MDNGLIFPYPLKCAHAEPSDAKRPMPAILRDDPAAEATQTGSRQAVGVTQEGSSTGRWLSRSKGVGRCVGKSAHHMPEA
jgi:hypothetical protein